MTKEQELRKEIARVNKSLVSEGLVKLTWGNASGIVKDRNYIIIKPSGVPFEDLHGNLMSKVNYRGTLEGKYKPSVDTPTHLALYSGFPEIGGIVHTHSTYATTFAQMRIPIPALGTTHADHFNGSIPVVADLTKEEILNNYEKNIGLGIVKYFKDNEINHLEIPAALVPSHGVFTWGVTPKDALENSIVLEEVAKMAIPMIPHLIQEIPKANQDLLNFHYQRKHGESKYYGQEK
jgi:L-ribulose-5-phosphate 4-epimerase